MCAHTCNQGKQTKPAPDLRGHRQNMPRQSEKTWTIKPLTFDDRGGPPEAANSRCTASLIMDCRRSAETLATGGVGTDVPGSGGGPNEDGSTVVGSDPCVGGGRYADEDMGTGAQIGRGTGNDTGSRRWQRSREEDPAEGGVAR